MCLCLVRYVEIKQNVYFLLFKKAILPHSHTQIWNRLKHCQLSVWKLVFSWIQPLELRCHVRLWISCSDVSVSENWFVLNIEGCSRRLDHKAFDWFLQPEMYSKWLLAIEMKHPNFVAHEIQSLKIYIQWVDLDNFSFLLSNTSIWP